MKGQETVMRSLLTPFAFALAFGAATPIKDGHATCVFSGIPAGTYAVAVFHAEHNETQMETGLFGKPKQGYGFSNNPSSIFGPPSFDSAAFSYSGGVPPLP